jgi:sigma-B regulation protein RsbU (phosphoserine phosphatase)
MLGIVPLSGRMTRDLAALSAGAAEMARGNLDVRVPVRSGDEIGTLAGVFNSMGASLQQQQRALLEQERMRQELAMGRQIQDEMLPPGRSSLAMAELRAVSIPAREVGGDFFNYFELDDGSVALVMGDVSGKGVAAALLMANLQATLRARLPLGGDLATLARRLDAELESSTPARTYVTLFLGVLEPRRQLLRWVNAGHNPQYVVHREGGLGRMASSGRPLGLVAGGGYVENEHPVSPGDSLFFYTDGLVESEDAAGDPFGAARLEALLVANAGHDPDATLESVEAAVARHRGKAEAADDATIMVLRLRT